MNKPIQWAFRTDLKATTARVAAALDTAPSMYAECWRSAEWIADMVGLCVSTVKKCIRELELKGLVQVVKDYSLKTRRRIVLLWRAAAPEPEPEPEPEPAPEPAPAPPARRMATPEEVAHLVKEADEIFFPADEIKEMARYCGLDLVARAVRYALRNRKPTSFVTILSHHGRNEGMPACLADIDPWESLDQSKEVDHAQPPGA